VRRQSEGRYLAYMLRLWQAKGEGEPLWRASLEDVRTGERRGFASLEELFAYLKDETGHTKGPAPPRIAGEGMRRP